PKRDIEIINLELALSDLETLERRLDRARKTAKSGDKKILREIEALEAIKARLDEGKSARGIELDEDGAEILHQAELLSAKPVIYAANLDESAFAGGYADNAYYNAVLELAAAEGSEVLPICAKTEKEISELPEEERAMFLEELGISASGLDRLIERSYSLLGLISFLTAGSDECRAWTIRHGTRAPQAAGKIHSDFERGFIRAETISFADLKSSGTMAAARDLGLIRSEGKEYIMRDGDIVTFRFNV
ncbi:MAG: YchF family ATPase, partial [Oscillospiraceae bacterium]|nr:YchF family ATPase [Oscillospiraceae bacterium]